jgi:hypothetical protein
VHQTGHLDLLDSPEVAQRLRHWLSYGASGAGATPAAPTPA